jgi:hypothetical protein
MNPPRQAFAVPQENSLFTGDGLACLRILLLIPYFCSSKNLMSLPNFALKVFSY